MKRFETTICVLTLSLLTLIIATPGVKAQNPVKGSLTVDGTTTAINHVYFDQYREEFTIILTSNPVAPEMVPDGIYSLSEEDKIKALEFTVSRETQKMLSRMRKAIYFHPVWTRSIDIGNGELSISKFDEKILEGTIKTPSESENDGHKFSYDISFVVLPKSNEPAHHKKNHGALKDANARRPAIDHKPNEHEQAKRHQEQWHELPELLGMLDEQ